MISVDISFIRKDIHKTSSCYQRADWDSFRDFLRKAPWNNIQNIPINNSATEIFSLIKAGIDALVYVPPLILLKISISKV